MYDSLKNMSPSESAKNLDRYFFKLLEEINIDCFIEAGAYNGETSLKVRDMSNCDIYSFEANPFNFNNFKNNFLEKNIQYYNLAVSNVDQPINILIQKEIDGVNIDPIKKNNSLKIKNSKNILYDSIEIKSITLDNFFLKKYYNNIGLWIDVEGLGYEVLQGSIKILKNAKILKIEVENKPIWENQKLDHEVIDFLKKQGFSPILRDYEYKSQYNIIFLKI